MVKVLRIKQNKIVLFYINRNIGAVTSSVPRMFQAAGHIFTFHVRVARREKVHLAP